MDSKFHFCQHIAKMANKALKAIMALKQLKGLLTAMLQQLFTAIMASVIVGKTPA
jgi:hypothetical protein